MNEQLLALINKLISKLDSMAPNLIDSEEVLLASKALQELVNTQSGENTLKALKTAIHDLEVLINSIDTNLTALINANDVDISALTANVDSHLSDFSNPHTVTKAQIGLPLVDNYSSTSDVEDNAVDKFSTAKAVNTVWVKAKSAISDAPLDNKIYSRKQGAWVELDSQYTFDTVPIGAILPFYGKSAPDGYLLCDGREITNSDYPDLVSHISGLRQAKFKTTEPISYTGGNWVKGLMELKDVHGITWANTSDNTGLNNLLLLGKFITPNKNNQLVALIKEFDDCGSIDVATKIQYSKANARYTIQMIHGDWDAFKGQASGKSIDIYNSISDIALKSSVYLPDLRGMFLRGYDSRASREIMSSEQDAIRNITGKIGAVIPSYHVNYASGAFHGISDAGPVPVTYAITGGSITNETDAFGYNIDVSRVVPTSTENRPKNVNPLFIIKAKYL